MLLQQGVGEEGLVTDRSPHWGLWKKRICPKNNQYRTGADEDKKKTVSALRKRRVREHLPYDKSHPINCVGAAQKISLTQEKQGRTQNWSGVRRHLRRFKNPALEVG